MTKRAQRLGAFLERSGWTVWPQKVCPSCGHVDYLGEDKFCRQCGTKMGKSCASDKDDAIEQLEAAIAHALGERVA